MILNFVKIERFKNLLDFERKFDPGLTVMRAMNEEGKSSLMAVLRLAIFGDATTSKKDILNQKSWSAERLFKIELGFHENNERYAIVRDFENKKNTLTRPDGTSVKDKKTIERTILRLLGFPSETSYLCSASITQDEIRRIESGANELRSLLEERIIGAGPVDLNVVMKGSKKYNRSCTKGGKDPGPLTRLNVEISKLKETRNVLEQELSRSHSEFIELKKVTEDLGRLQADFNIKSKAYEKSRNYLDAKKRYDLAAACFKEIQEKIHKRKKATEENLRLPSQIAQFEKELNDNEAALKKSRSYRELQQAEELINQKLTGLNSKIQRIESLTGRLNGLDTKIRSLILIEETEYENALSIPKEIEALEVGLNAQGILLNIVPKQKLSIEIAADEKTKELLTLEDKLSISAKHRIQFSIDGIVDIEGLSQTEGIQAVVDEIKRKKQVWNSILHKYKVRGNDDLRKVMDEQKAMLTQKKELSTQLNTLLGTDAIEGLRSEASKLREEIQKISQQRDELMAYALTESQTQEKLQKVNLLREEVEKLKAQLHENRGILQEVKDEKILNEERDKSVTEMAISDRNLKDLQQFQCSAEDIVRMEQELKNLQDIMGTLNTRKAVLEDRVSNVRLGSDDLGELTEKIEYCEESAARYKRRVEVNEIILEKLAEARRVTIEGISSMFEEKVGHYLSEITEGKHEKIRLEQNFNISLYSNEKQDWIDPVSSPTEVSSGLLDELYFAARLALVEIIATDHRPPLFMDDPFIHFDSARRNKALNLLQKFAEKFQVIVFTCHDYPLPPSVNVVELHSLDRKL